MSTATGIPAFADLLEGRAIGLRSGRLDTVQINVGRLCNQTCMHCHVDAGPSRTEIMCREVAEACIAFARNPGIRTVDITGGAPELCPQFELLVEGAHGAGRDVLVRCNLTVIFQAGKQHLPAFYRDHAVQLFCSLPCYLEDNVDRQRGNGVYQASLEALRVLNAHGYGMPGSPLVLNLVYNPVGLGLPSPQEQLEADYKHHLLERFGIRFHGLVTIANMPIKRFERWLRATGKHDFYMQRLFDAFEWANLDGLMCRNLVSVGWKGDLYDCDFNQMLDMPLRNPATGENLKIGTVTPADLENRLIAVGNHCYGCMAGAGSSCRGAIRP
jgi:radical SAM/Cys-rich protein